MQCCTLPCSQALKHMEGAPGIYSLHMFGKMAVNTFTNNLNHTARSTYTVQRYCTKVPDILSFLE